MSDSNKSEELSANSIAGFDLESDWDRSRSQLPLAGSRLQPNPDLMAEGWERRFVASGPRLQEMAELYEQLGYELLLEDVQKKDMPDECEDCQLVALLKFKTLYTRRQGRPKDE